MIHVVTVLTMLCLWLSAFVVMLLAIIFSDRGDE